MTEDSRLDSTSKGTSTLFGETEMKSDVFDQPTEDFSIPSQLHGPPPPSHEQKQFASYSYKSPHTQNSPKVNNFIGGNQNSFYNKPPAVKNSNLIKAKPNHETQFAKIASSLDEIDDDYRLTIFKVKETETPLWGKTNSEP
mmetsp:Transcript_42705/g.65557  ORF Transcript_42705/g.65557 Transcript_42705/m.65557 type:complete len:141 (+) Transcript_42705:2853-3275(+)